jgi:hypothetical protein
MGLIKLGAGASNTRIRANLEETALLDGRIFVLKQETLDGLPVFFISLF